VKNGFAKTWPLVRLILRLDRLKMSLWLLGLSALVAITPWSIRDITQSEADARGVAPEVVLAEQGQIVETNAAMVALSGPADALDTFGGRYAFEIGAFSLGIVGLMNILLVARHTRAEEESGRADLVRSAAVGAWSPIAAVTIAAVTANAVLALVTFGAFSADGIEPGEALLYGLSIAVCGLSFAAIALIWAQVFEYSRAATAASLATLAAAYTVRAVGDVRDNWLSWLSPIGWAQKVNAFGDSNPWALVVALAAIATFIAVAIGLVLKRDVGAGMIAQRPGPASASPGLVSPMGLAWRLQRSGLLWWSLGVGFLGLVYGSVISAMDDFIEDNETMRDMLEAMGMDEEGLRDGFITMILTMTALVACAGVIQMALRARGEENGGRAEPILAGHVPRPTWLGSHLVIAFLAAPVLMIVSTLALYTADAMMVGEYTDLVGGLEAGLARVPAIWAIAGLGVFLYGLATRYSMGVWVVFGVSAVVFYFGGLLQLSESSLRVSPLSHITHLPADSQGMLALMVLTVIGLGSMAMGVGLFTRRDVGV
jgi:ABC-2 type transport system permease protein